MSDNDTQAETEGVKTDTLQPESFNVNNINVERPPAEPVESLNAEAAKYRTRLRDTETERDTLAARLEAVQRQQVEDMVVAARVKPEAVWLTADLPSMLTDDGLVDPDRVTEAIAAARDRLGITPVGKGTHVPGVGNHPQGPVRVDGWEQAFGKR